VRVLFAVVKVVYMKQSLIRVAYIVVSVFTTSHTVHRATTGAECKAHTTRECTMRAAATRCLFAALGISPFICGPSAIAAMAAIAVIAAIPASAVGAIAATTPIPASAVGAIAPVTPIP